jgi:hypothetical protein
MHLPARGVSKAIRSSRRSPQAARRCSWRRSRAVSEHALRAATQATIVLDQTGNLSANAIVVQVRAAAVDLLRGSGVTGEEASASCAEPPTHSCKPAASAPEWKLSRKPEDLLVSGFGARVAEPRCGAVDRSNQRIAAASLNRRRV